MLTVVKNTESPKGRPTTLAGPGSVLDIRYTLGINTDNMKGTDNCSWLLLGSTERCNRSCLKGYCKIHLMRLRKCGGTQPCKSCGVGIKNDLRLCIACGYEREKSKQYMRRLRAFEREFARLVAIEIPY